jgi:hypothetical protein
VSDAPSFALSHDPRMGPTNKVQIHIYGADARPNGMPNQGQQQQQQQQPQQQTPQNHPVHLHGQQPYEQGTPMQQTDSAGRGNSPPDRKRMRRNSGSAAPSPFPGTNASLSSTPQHQHQHLGYTPQGTPVQAVHSIPGMSADQVGSACQTCFGNT